ncbi:hypothetical protein M427DRAFT_464054 [Gonapodya prolifera JEL478]|uniref:Uncharacterized protein n=1 Tax=Gonapodya prolifera (strain JEL478) TaxID=1344416 RepID=A0A139A2W1_GONPJ|nr:hypothetical protein M427DRAFT_464054 [Gonapodya prolifera JEL478]|eukprot:KXS10693.1 hypothetical protein M427DRAFT_464054 [Gonapodya prolifera JEL478]
MEVWEESRNREPSFLIQAARLLANQTGGPSLHEIDRTILKWLPALPLEVSSDAVLLSKTQQEALIAVVALLNESDGRHEDIFLPKLLAWIDVLPRMQCDTKIWMEYSPIERFVTEFTTWILQLAVTLPSAADQLTEAILNSFVSAAAQLEGGSGREYWGRGLRRNKRGEAE